MTSLQPGDTIGPYRVTQQMGAGGSSVVFQAVDTLVNRPVAIKQLNLDSTDDQNTLSEQLHHEAARCKQLDWAHCPQLVQLIDVIDHDRSMLLIREYVEGPSLEQILSQNPEPMSSRQAMGILAATALALQSLHEAGLLHRNLKPTNILMPRAGGLKVSDFGMASASTQQDFLSLGSARYMAPELLAGQSVDGRADLYALGMIGYEMLAGRTKFEQTFRSVLRDTRNQAMRWMKWHTHPRSTATPLSQLIPTIDASVSDLIARLMEKDPGKRIGSASELLAVIQRLTQGETPPPQVPLETPDVLAVSVAPAEDTAALPSRRRGVRVLTGGLALLLLGALGVGGYQLYTQRQQVRAAARQSHQLLEEARQAFAAEDYENAITLYQTVSEQWDASSARHQHAQAWQRIAQSQRDQAAGRYDDAFKALRQAQQYHVVDPKRLGDWLDHAQQQAAFAHALDDIERTIAEGQFNQARQSLSAWRDLTLSDAEADQLRQWATRLEDQRAKARVRDILDRMEQLVEQGQRSQAIAELTQRVRQSPSRQLEDRLNQLQTREAYDQALAKAAAAESQGDLDQAIDFYRQASDLKQDPAIDAQLKQLRSLRNLQQGLAFLRRHDTPRAEAALTRALGFDPNNEQARAALKSIESSSQKQSFVTAGDTAMRSGDFDTAAQQYRNALDFGADTAVQDKLNQALTRAAVLAGLNALNAGQLDRATQFITQAVRLSPNNRQALAAQRQLKTFGEYQRHLQAGDAARNRSDFGRAKFSYAKAQRILDTPAIRQRLDEAEYEHLIAQARAFLQAKEYAPARSLLRIAASRRMTDEIQSLLDAADQEDKP